MKDKSEIFGLAVIAAGSAAIASSFLAEWGGLELITVFVAGIVLLETVISFSICPRNDMFFSWGVCAFHILWFLSFWGMMTVCEHPIFQPFTYARVSYYTLEPVSEGYWWWVILGLLAVRLFIVQPIIYLVCEKNKKTS